MAETIKVKAAKKDGKVVIWETHPDHPAGEIFISGDDNTHDAAETAEVLLRIKAGTLVKVFDPSATKPAAPEPDNDTASVPWGDNPADVSDAATLSVITTNTKARK